MIAIYPYCSPESVYIALHVAILARTPRGTVKNNHLESHHTLTTNPSHWTMLPGQALT